MSEIKVDTVAEKTSANGVTIDGLNIKDSKLVTANSIVEANITDGAISAAKLASGVGGITMADGYRQNADVNHGTGDPVLDSNWEKIDTNSFGFIGTGMSESSGIFTFPATGIYYIAAQCSITDASATNRVDWRIQTTVNNSSYADNSISHMFISSSNYKGTGFCSTIFDVQNTSNYKLRFALYDINNVNPATIGSSSETFTGFTVYRLGDT